MRSSRVPSATATGLAAFVLLALGSSGCPAPERQMDSFTAPAKANPAAEESSEAVGATGAAAKQARKFIAKPKGPAPAKGERRSGSPGDAEATATTSSVGELEIHFIKVGQGDSALIELPRKSPPTF